MPPALNLISGVVTNPSTTITAVTPNAGDSFSVRATNAASTAYLLQAWGFSATAGLVRIRSARLHDPSQAIRSQYPASQPRPLLPWGVLQPVYQLDPITVEMTGDAAAVDLVSMLFYYQDLSGIAGNFQGWAQIKPRILNIFSVEVDMTSSATAGIYGGAVALNALYDIFKHDEQYAILGYNSGTNGGAIRITGVDTGNIGIGGPLYNQTELTNSWFVGLSQAYGLPLIPVIKGANVAGITVDMTSQSTTTAYKVSIVMAELHP